MTEASPSRPACVKGEEGEVEVGVGVKGDRLTRMQEAEVSKAKVCCMICIYSNHFSKQS